MEKNVNDPTISIRCPRCKRMVGDDIYDNLYIVHSTDYSSKKILHPEFILEVKCSKCHIYNTIFSGGIKNKK